MKTFLFFYLSFFILHLSLHSQTQQDFNTVFHDKTMRIDFYQTGDADECYFSIDQIYEYDKWSGNPHKLIDQLNYGMYYLQVYDLGSNELLYSHGFATIFGEYRTTKPAQEGIKKSFHQTLLIPYPKHPIRFVILDRDENNLLRPVFSQRIDPGNINIIREKPATGDQVFDIQVHGDIHDKADFVFIAEGYTSSQQVKFVNDVLHFTEVLFQVEPFKSQKEHFNIRAVMRPSAESGVDEPHKGIFRNSVVSASYNALDLDRYLLIDDTKTLRDIASAVPYDALIVIANTDRYGGGGIYNDYTIFTSDDNRSEAIFLHEFGHGFANLADEYYGSAVSYNEFFPPGREPHEPNITRLLDPDNVKWKHLLSPGIEIPTYWGQNETDSLRSLIREIKDTKQHLENQLISASSKSKLEKKIQVLNTEITRLNQEVEKNQAYYYERYQGKVGVFEGAGYSSRGIYRSGINIGFNDEKEFNQVSTEAILNVLRLLAE